MLLLFCQQNSGEITVVVYSDLSERSGGLPHVRDSDNFLPYSLMAEHLTLIQVVKVRILLRQLNAEVAELAYAPVLETGF